MNARPQTIAAPEVAQIEDALDVLLRTAIEADLERARARDRNSEPFQMTSIGEMMALDLSRSAAARHAAELVKDPLGMAARMAIRTLGKRLHEIGGLRLMSEVLDNVAERDPRREGYRSGIMDCRWDGIGRTADNPGWCS